MRSETPIKVEYGIPMPASVFPWRKMAVGESLAFPAPFAEVVGFANRRHKRTGHRYLVGYANGKTRVTRLA